MSVQQEKFKAIADKIRSYTKKEDLIKPNDFSTEIDNVYTQGRQAVYNEFWDEYTDNGTRRDYSNAFEGAFWTDDTFKPQYDMSVVLNANYMFQNCKITDLSKINIVESQGAYSLCFGVTSLVTFGSIDVSYYDVNNGGNFGQAFYDCKNLVSIGTLTVGAKTSFSYTFYNCNNLTDVTFNGKIGQSLDMSACPLNKASIESIFNIIYIIIRC